MKRDLKTNPECVVQEWMYSLPFQQQSVMLLAARGPDGVEKHHPCKAVVRAYRACVLNAAYYGRPLTILDEADTFMDLRRFGSSLEWSIDVDDFFSHIDSLPKHYTTHLAHGAQIMGFRHPVPLMRYNWRSFYYQWCDSLHVNPETEEQMDERLNDRNQDFWDK